MLDGMLDGLRKAEGATGPAIIANAKLVPKRSRVAVALLGLLLAVPTFASAASLFGGIGNDTLIGGGGNDDLHGNAGADLLRGAGGNDDVFGDADDDTIELTLATDGADDVDGGTGVDTFVLVVTPAEASANAASIASLQAFIDANSDPASDTGLGAAGSFPALGLTSIRNIEALSVGDPIGFCGAMATPIHDIQGSGPVSPDVGNTREFEGVVVGDFQGPAGLNGFVVQEEDAEADADPMTSEAIFVFDPANTVPVAVGDLVRVRGTVAEVDGSTVINDVEAVMVCSSGIPLPALEIELSVTKDDGVTSAVPGGQVTYTIAVSNDGASADSSVMVTDTFPADLTCIYTGVGAGGTSGHTAGPAAGDIADSLDMPPGSTVTYTVTCDIAPGATGTLSNTATAMASFFLTDPDPRDNSATDADTLLVPQVRQGCGGP